ncbi:MAG: PadR family transcriptional regulator [Gemmatimonadetes bacterium]|nr:MAG: PadR family transcriptional regulator [Gemmatimonadota bacterium]
MARTKRPEDLLPLTPQVYGVLLALGDETRHGYAIIQEFERRTGEQGTLLPGSLYNTLGRMLRAGLVEEVPAPPDETDHRRRYYHSTPFGKAVARAESARLARLLRLAEANDLLVDPA